MLSLLVVGLLPHESGKTTFASSLVEEAKERGIDVGVSKPVSGFSGWYQYDYVVKSIEKRLLIGEDVYRLHEAAKSSDPIEIESPVVSLLLTPDPERVEWKSAAYTSLALQYLILAVRVTNINQSRHYYVPQNIERTTTTLRKEVEKLVAAVNPRQIGVEDIERLLLASRKDADECLNYIKQKHEFTVIESYNNAAAPTTGSVESDIVVAIAPGKAAVFSGSNYRKAIIALSDLKEPWKVTTEDIIPLLHPEKTIELKPGKTEGVLDSLLYYMEKTTREPDWKPLNA